MSDMIEEPCVRDAQHRHVDPAIQGEIQDVQTVDLTHTDQHEEIESQFLDTPLVEQVVDADRLMSTYFQDRPALMRMHSLLVRTTIARVWTHLHGIQAQMIVAG
jgi:hypothetical protein